MKMVYVPAAGITAALAIGLAAAGQAAGPAAQPAVYWISAETQSGLGGMAGMGGGGMAMGMAAMFGGGMKGGNTAHSLALQLGSGQRATGTAEGQHFIPPALAAGKSLPLNYQQVATPERRDWKPETESQTEGGHARLKLYWGCGDPVSAGQPRILDSRSPASFAALKGVDARAMQELTAQRFTSYGEWPNAKNSRTLKGDSSLVGDHLIQANYSPDIRFNLNAAQDFLAPLKVSQQRGGNGATQLSWPSVARAKGYFIAVMGQDKDGSTVIWTSSAIPMAGFALPQWMTPAEVTRLVGQKAMLPGTATSCTVPAAVTGTMESAFLTMAAFGDETNLAEPKPAGAPATWKPAWTVKLRYKSSTSMLLGENAMAMGGDEAEDAGDGKPAKKKKGSLLRKLGDVGLPF
ncbi:hypothetical protein SAMN06295912_101400 [Sphingomonas laterariae]|uniref:Uncharacterized protein n=1 Tax=Edaphosphingomonas laterariae TaxID=861865 RepID=A0A239BUW8_9SPHN|nr:hypothetical protein [Sphingomonas laterariae]SNS11211.1 hypothetical protein SAMN06295912_101400 [Sphingomonas laterariae]